MNTATNTSIGSRANVMLWLLSGCFLIFMMVIVGGITRLTGSGLSITEWKVVTGTIPPLNQNDWLKEFHNYMNSPQFVQINSHFGLNDFKEIYWWEYIHRLLGRLIGVVFLVPFAWFWFTRQLTGDMKWKSLLLFAMGGLQGFIGWYMVKSGLVDRPSVSHLRLALHLSTAFATFGLTFWFAMGLLDARKLEPTQSLKNYRRWVALVFAVVIVQIIYGAFVAGLKAGLIYNTWPDMQGDFMPGAVRYGIRAQGISSLINNMTTVQFIHRTTAWLVVASVALLWWRSLPPSMLDSRQRLALHIVMGAVVVQFLLGVYTLLFAVPLVLGVLHQAGAFALLSAFIYLLHTLKRGPAVQVKTE
ncbi:MAG TPA: COX15/CtaA family protein [Bacteroidia bacterium]|nr:COX15/CtaA family protein [Bacteroidia bacterium]